MLVKRGDACGARTFGNNPLLFDKAADGPFERLFVDQKDIIDEIGDHGARDAARLLDRDALRQRFAAAGDVLAGDGKFHRRIEFGLHADDPDVGAHVAGDCGDAANQAAAANGHDKHVQFRVVRQHLQPDRPLTCHHMLVVIGVDQRQAARLDELADKFFAFIEIAAFKNDLGAVRAGARYFRKRRLRRHHDHCGNAHLAGVIGHRLGMVSGRHGDDSALPRFIGQRLHRDKGAAGLEGRGVLEVFKLQLDLAAERGREHRRVDERCWHDMAFKPFRSSADIVRGDGHGCLPCIGGVRPGQAAPFRSRRAARGAK